jgi:hypothetical protein
MTQQLLHWIVDGVKHDWTGSPALPPSPEGDGPRAVATPYRLERSSLFMERSEQIWQQGQTRDRGSYGRGVYAGQSTFALDFATEGSYGRGVYAGQSTFALDFATEGSYAQRGELPAADDSLLTAGSIYDGASTHSYPKEHL